MTRNNPSQRYARQVQYGPIGSDGQRLLSESRVTVLGCGALGTVAAEILARAGVGNLRLIDRDIVEWSNLQRQSLFTEEDAQHGQAKAAAARRRLAVINSEVEVVPVVVDVLPESIADAIGVTDLVIDATDNFAVRLLLNDWSLATETPWVHGGCVGAEGQVMLFTGRGKPCFRCFVPQPPPTASVDTCDTAGVVGAATHLIASLQAAEAIKWLTHNRGTVRKNLLSMNVWTNRVREVEFGKQVDCVCPACGDRNYEFLNEAHPPGTVSAMELCGRDSVQISCVGNGTVDLEATERRWEDVGRVQRTPFFVRVFLDETLSLTLFGDGRVVVQGTEHVSEARKLYDQFVGG